MDCDELYYLDNVDHNGMAEHFTRSDCERVLRSAVYPMQWLESMVCCGMTVKRMGMLGMCVRMMNTLSVKLETVTMMGKVRKNLPSFVYYPLPDFCLGGCSSYIRVVLHSGK